MSPRDRRRWRLLLNDRRELLAYRETLYKLLQSADESRDTLLEEIDGVDETIQEDEEALAALAIKFAQVDEEALATLTIKYVREDEAALTRFALNTSV